MSLKRCFAALFVSLAAVAAAHAAPGLKALIVDGQNNHNWKATTPPITIAKTIAATRAAFTNPPCCA